MGTGNDLVCRAIEILATSLIGVLIEELMAGFGTRFRALADEPRVRWLGPHDSNIGWFQYDSDRIHENARRCAGPGLRSFQVKGRRFSLL